jgi:tetratricopeptide (TPR) repeat protein
VLVAKREGDKASLLRFLTLQAGVEMKQNNLPDAALLFEEADPLCRQLNDRLQLVASLVFRAAVLSEYEKQNDKALSLAEEGFRLAQDLDEETEQRAWTVLSNIRRAKLQDLKVTEKGDGHMSLQEKAVVQEIFKRLKATGKQDHIIRVLMAVKQLDNGIGEALKNNYDKAVGLHESALRQLRHVDEATALRAMVKGRLVEDYAGVGRVAEALTSGKEAIDELGKDPKLESSYAECLLNLGAVLAHSDPGESLSYLERAKLIYETRADGRDALAVCLENMELARSNIESAPKQTPSKSGWWSRFIGES